MAAKAASNTNIVSKKIRSYPFMASTEFKPDNNTSRLTRSKTHRSAKRMATMTILLKGMMIMRALAMTTRR